MAKKDTKAILATWIVCGMDGNPLYDDDKPKEFKSAASALKLAKEHVQFSEDDEAWVFKLSHVVSRPKIEPEVEEVK